MGSLKSASPDPYESSQRDPDRTPKRHQTTIQPIRFNRNPQLRAPTPMVTPDEGDGQLPA